MKVKNLTIGGVYRCAMSNRNVLIVTADMVVNQETSETKSVTSGKVWIESELKYSLIELHDGQLKNKSLLKRLLNLN